MEARRIARAGVANVASGDLQQLPISQDLASIADSGVPNPGRKLWWPASHRGIGAISKFDVRLWPKVASYQD